jgi:chromosome partitioning protein
VGYAIGFISQKGGVGKSTLARALACEVSKQGMSVKISDLDIQQATSVNWHRRRMLSKLTPEIAVECHGSAAKSFIFLKDYDLLIIDGPARASKGTLEISKLCNLVIQPTGASLDDLEPAILTFHELVKEGIPREKLAFALCRIGTEAEAADCRDYIDKAGYSIISGCLYERPSYRQVQNLGYAVTETRYPSLNKNADSLIQSIIDRLANG